MNRPARDEGFTLIEVLMALAILGASLFLLMESHYGSLMLFSDAQDTSNERFLFEYAVGLAEQKVLTQELSGGGDFGDRFPEYSYTFNAVPLNPEVMPGLFEITVKLKLLDDESEVKFMIYDSNQVDAQESI